jgi:hypothetical protein
MDLGMKVPNTVYSNSALNMLALPIRPSRELSEVEYDGAGTAALQSISTK